MVGVNHSLSMRHASYFYSLSWRKLEGVIGMYSERPGVATRWTNQCSLSEKFTYYLVINPGGWKRRRNTEKHRCRTLDSPEPTPPTYHYISTLLKLFRIIWLNALLERPLGNDFLPWNYCSICLISLKFSTIHFFRNSRHTLLDRNRAGPDRDGRFNHIYWVFGRYSCSRVVSLLQRRYVQLFRFHLLKGKKSWTSQYVHDGFAQCPGL